MDQRVLDLNSFMISPTLGFLPSPGPSTSFNEPTYAVFDEVVSELPDLISTHSLRQRIDSLPLIDAATLRSEADVRRAYVILGYLVHAYVWGNPGSLGPLDTVPPQLTEPFLHACDELGMEPVLSYAGLCLWNWTPKDPELAPADRFFQLDELVPVASFTGTRGEAAFDHVSVLIEAEGGPLVPLLLEATAAARRGDAALVTRALVRTAATIERMKQHLAKLYSALDTSLFYDRMRPFFNGGKGMEDAGLPRGVVFRRADGTERAAKCAGGSAAQSSLFQFLDVVLGVKHEPVEGSEESLFETMRAYMPGKHREFLRAVSAQASIRPFVERQAADEHLRGAYDVCLEKLRSWRGSHIAVVSKYVVRPAREARKSASESSAGGEGGLHGTGGSDLVTFLRQSRDETVGISSVG